jgi:8-amino-7-oxononanoate synthase
MHAKGKFNEFYHDAEFSRKLGYLANPRTLQALGVYPFFIPIQRSEGPEILINGKKYIMIGSNNYLGLTSHPEVEEAAVKAIKDYGTACTGSRLLNGTLELHLKLEDRLAGFVGKEKALVFTTGFLTNLGTITAVMDRNDAVIADKHTHASIIDAMFLAKAQKNIKLRFFKHNDVNALNQVLSKGVREKSRLVIVDGVYSMGGDVAKLRDITSVCRRHDTMIMVDDAHGIGVMGSGRGTAHHFGCTDDIDLIMGTFSKSLASTGGFIAGSREVIHWIQHFARPFIFSASLSPASLGAASAALDIIEREPERIRRVFEISEMMRSEFRGMGFDVGQSETPIVPVIIGDHFKTVEAWRTLYQGGIFANVALPPAVPPKSSRLRISFMATHTNEHLDLVLKAFKILKTRLIKFRSF